MRSLVPSAPTRTRHVPGDAHCWPSRPSLCTAKPTHVQQRRRDLARSPPLVTPAVSDSGESSGAASSSTVVSLDTGEQVEQLSVPLLARSNELVRADLRFPLGVVFEARDSLVVVAEVTPGGAADDAGEHLRLREGTRCWHA